MRDVLRNAAGTVVLVAAAVCNGIALLRKSCERFKDLVGVLSDILSPAGLSESVCHYLLLARPIHSHPVPFRI
jgi:adenosyl cobinamide kinase/adenosyl cobinamide phosphate guanylyltransferase